LLALPAVSEDVDLSWLFVVCDSLHLTVLFLADHGIVNKDVLDLSLDVFHRLLLAHSLVKAAILTAVEARVAMVAPTLVQLVVRVPILRSV